MTHTTKDQRKALKRIYDRTVASDHGQPLTYRAWRRTVHGSFGCIMVKALGLWLGLEPDGYTHS